MATHVRGHADDAAGAAPSPSTTATTCAGRPAPAGVRDALRLSRASCRLYIRPLFCQGKGPFRWAALSGDPDDIARHRRGVLEAVPRRRRPRPLDRAGARSASPFQGLPARICWLGYGERARFGPRSTSWSATGKVKAPIVIGRDHLDCGSVASPNRETEAMKDGSDAIADWPILNALLNAASARPGCRSTTAAASDRLLAARRHGDRRRRHRAGGERLERVLTGDPGIGVARHADAGYPQAIATAKQKGVKLP